ncbi:unnamed protein product [Strongylus vulgaris]|uniref:Fatty-acid and retinol-binding protein 1 n=1 Tax=Strongylus vulgaris TaxID=40348 RepID=A0A3P7IK65_STRVU|nr:unnamed protein product [Strongylus vulgaris]
MLRELIAIVAFLCIVHADFGGNEGTGLLALFIFFVRFEIFLLDVIPKEAKEFFTGLTEEDKKVIKDVVRDSANMNADEALAALKEKSPELGAKAEKLYAVMKEKVDALGTEAKTFIRLIFTMIRKVHSEIVLGNKPSKDELRKKVESAISKYNALPDPAKDDLQKQFPLLSSVFKSGKLHKMAEKLLSKY